MNQNALIVGPTGKNLFKIGDNAHEQFRTGQYNVSIEWHIDGRNCEPVMAIWSKIGGRNAGCFGICLSSIGKYADDSGDPTREAFVECWNALPTLGKNQIDLEVHELLRVILRHTPDLIRCPPAPKAVRRHEVGQPLLEVTQITNGQRVDEAVL